MRRSNKIVYALNNLLKDRIKELEEALEYLNINNSCSCNDLPLYYKNKEIKCSYCYAQEVLNKDKKI